MIVQTGSAVVSTEALATADVRVITKLYIDKKEGQWPAFNYLEIKLNQSLRYGNSPFDLFIRLKCLYFRSILFSIIHNDSVG